MRCFVEIGMGFGAFLLLWWHIGNVVSSSDMGIGCLGDSCHHQELNKQ